MSETNKLNGAQVIVDYLIQQKVPYAFGLCGHGNIQFIDALYERQRDIKTISVHHESVAGFMADVYYRVSGQPVATFTSCGPGLGQSADLARDRVSRLGAVSRGHRQRADQPVQSRRLPGDVPPPSGGFPVDRARLLQEGLSADARRDGAARGAAGMEDDGDGAAGAGRARRAVRRVHGSGRRGGAEPAGMERQHFKPLRRRSGRRRQGGRHAARCRAAGHVRRAGDPLRRRGRRAACARRAAADSGRGVDERARRDRHASSARARPGRARRPLSGEPRDAAGRRAALARRALRRPHVELVDPGLLLHDPADEADPRRHRSGRDRPQLSGRARPDGRRAHLPAAGAGRTRPPQGHRQEASTRARNGSRRSTAIARNGTSSSRPASPTTASRSIRSAPPSRSTAACPRTRSSSATSACTTTGCSATASRSGRTR